MKLINRAKFLGLCAAGLLSLAVRPASAQVLTPSRVGGALATRGDGTIVAVTRSTDNGLQFGQRNGFDGVGWSQWDAWYALGGYLASPPVILMNANSKLLILVRGGDDRLYTRQETTAGSKVFDPWFQIGPWAPDGSPISFVGKPALARRANGLLSIYATDKSGKLWESTQLSSGGAWGAWQPLGSPTGVTLRDSPVVSVMANGSFALFSVGTSPATGSTRKLFTRVQNSGSWSSEWLDLGGFVDADDSVATGVNSNGRVSVIMNNTAGTVSFRTQTAVNANSWTPWANLLGGAHGMTLPAVTNHSDGRLAVFFYANYGTSLVVQSQTAPSSSTWSNWFDVQNPVTSAPVAIQDIRGKIHVIVLGWGGYIYERVQTAPNSTTWTDEGSGYFGGPFLPFG